jgi:D-alanine-D-alanine ligase
MNKFLVKKLLQQNGIPVPQYQLFNSANDFIDSTLRYPLISKLNEIHGAVEITKDAVSENEKHLRERLKFLISTYKQPVLVEEFIVGREITAMLLEGLNKKVYLAEKIFTNVDDKYVFSTFEDQWLNKTGFSFNYQKFDDPILKEYVKKAFDVTKMYDYGKFDVRLDQSGRYFFIDSNCNPAFGPKEADVAISNILDMYGISFQEILKRLLQNTMRDSQGKERIPLTPSENDQSNN